MYLLGLDIGSSSIKGSLVKASSKKTIAIAQSPDQEMPIQSSKKGWAEQDPETWWNHVKKVIKKIAASANISLSDIEAIGISYQMHGLVIVDKNQKVLRPAIIWCDSRSVSIGDTAFKSLGDQYCLNNLLNSPGNFTASKLRWIKENEPEIFTKIDKMMLPGDFIAMKLSGVISTTVTGLSEGIFWDFKEHHVSAKLLEQYGINPNMIPELTPTIGVQAKVNEKAAKETGLNVGTIIGYRAGDQPNNALSLNVFNPGEIAATGGTSGVVYGITDQLNPDENLRLNTFAHVNHSRDSPRLGQLVCINGSGILYNWLKNSLVRDNRSYKDLESIIASVPVGSEGVMVLPFGNGAERLLNNQDLSAHILNIDFNRHQQEHIYRAGLEGIAFSFIYGVEILQGLGTKVDTMKVGNDNLFQSVTFAETIATCLNCKIEMYDNTGAVGAAKAAGLANGNFKSYEEAFKIGQPIKSYTTIDDDNAYKEAYQKWKSNLEFLLKK